jgi:hypothetical protein
MMFEPSAHCAVGRLLEAVPTREADEAVATSMRIYNRRGDRSSAKLSDDGTNHSRGNQNSFIHDYEYVHYFVVDAKLTI